MYLLQWDLHVCKIAFAPHCALDSTLTKLHYKFFIRNWRMFKFTLSKQRIMPRPLEWIQLFMPHRFYGEELWIRFVRAILRKSAMIFHSNYKRLFYSTTTSKFQRVENQNIRIDSLVKKKTWLIGWEYLKKQSNLSKFWKIWPLAPSFYNVTKLITDCLSCGRYRWMFQFSLSEQWIMCWSREWL